MTTGRGEKIEVRDGGFVANNPTLYAIVDATESLGFAREDARVVSIGVIGRAFAGTFVAVVVRFSIRQAFGPIIP